MTRLIVSAVIALAAVVVATAAAIFWFGTPDER